MKAVYFLFSIKDRYFTDLSKILKDKNVFDKFYGLAYEKSLSLMDPIFSHISHVSDIIKKEEEEIDLAFIEKIERQYNICFASLIHMDRHLMRFDKKKRYYIAQEIVRLFINDITRFPISAVMAEGIDDCASFFANIFCRHHNIQYLHLGIDHMGLGAFLTDRLDLGPKDLENQFKEALHLINSGSTDVAPLKQKLEQYVAEKKRPAYYYDPSLRYKILERADIKKFLHTLFAYCRDRHALHGEFHPLSLPYIRFKRVFRKMRYNSFLKKHQVTLEKTRQMKYFIYPLHVEPESSTLVLARWFNNQKVIIEMISKCLPAGYVLLVKEHPSFLGRRALDFFYAVNHYHNVYFVAHNIDSYELLKHSNGIIVMSSTMGFEALLMGKPVLCFSDRFYCISKNVYRAQNFVKLQEEIYKLLNHQFDENDALALFYVLSKAGRDLGNDSPTTYDLQSLEKLANEVQRAINIS